ncbi:MAG: M48 family metalloprotease [candidate division Zixibacteria bacterium]|nr:M48 family metalloprotease [candidate division Zixibacteria bacterium]
MKKSVVVLVAAFVMVLTGCVTTGPGGKKSFVIIPVSQELAIGQGMAAQVGTSEKALADTAWQSYLVEVGRKVVRVCDRQDIEYHFTVIESDQVNAFAAPGGYVYFYTGLLREMDNEAEMAAVMAHEISHVVARHGVKRLQAALGATLAYELVFGGDKGGEALKAAVYVGLGLAFAGYSRDAEREADDFGIQYMVKAGYDPNGAIGMFEKLAALGSGSSSIFEQLSSSHPETSERIENARKEISEINPRPKNLTLGRDRYQKMVKRLPAKAPKK